MSDQNLELGSSVAITRIKKLISRYYTSVAQQTKSINNSFVGIPQNAIFF